MHSKIKILHLEDLPSDAELIGRELRKENLDFERLVVDTKDKFINALKDFSPDIILSDHSLPSFNSHEALEIFHKTGKKIPFILITATMSDEFAVDIIKRGADDYILKDRLSRLPTAIHQALEKFQLEKEKQDSLEELIRNEKRYQSLIENCTDGIVILSAEGKPMYVSASVTKMLGYSMEELMQMELFSILHEEDRPFMQTVMQKIIANPGIPIKGHTGRMLHKDGTYRWLEATGTNMLHDPAIKGIVDNFHDVTENKIAEQKLIHSNRLYAFISQINQAIVHLKDEQTLFETACRIAVEYGKFEMAWMGLSDIKNKKIKLVASYGATESDIQLLSDYFYDIGGPIESVLKGLSYYVVNDHSKEKSISKSKYLLEKGRYSGITLSIRKKGQVIGAFTVYSNKRNFFNASEIALLEEITRDISFALDILENARLKLHADAKLKESEFNLNAIFENTTEGFILTDINGIIKAFNNKSREIILLNVDKKIKIGESIFEYIHESRTENYSETLSKVLLGEVLHFNYPFKRKNGKTKWYHYTVNPVYNVEKIIGISITIEDITEKKKAEDLLAQSQSNIKAILENADATIYSLDRNLNLITFNQLFQNKVLEYYGINIKTGDHFSKVLEKTGRDEINYWKEIYLKILDGQIIKFEQEFNFNNNQTFNSFSFYPIFENNNVIGLSCFTLDITKEKQAEQKLLTLNEQLRKLSSYLETVREYERTNIAREVHDELGQQMTRLKMDIEWLNDNIKDKHPEVIKRIQTMMNMVVEGIKTTRRIVIQLRPGILDDLGLAAAIEWQANEFEKNTGIPCLLKTSIQQEKFPDQVNTAVFRIFQESLTNITRYANASEVNANLYEENNVLILEVMDNGIGITDERKNNKTSFGLMGMRERAANLKGSFTIQKMTKKGTKIQLKIPI